MNSLLLSKAVYPRQAVPVFLFVLVVFISAILTITMSVQFGFHEIPCPLCLLQRVALFGVGFGLLLAFRHGYSSARIGYALISSLFLLIVSARQTLNNIIQREGHHWVGGTLFGLHLPVWSVIVGLFLVAYLSLLLMLTASERGAEEKPLARHTTLLDTLGTLAMGYLVILCALNLLMVFLQCGFGICHTDSYWFLDW